jgi:16S rRNA (uracil1498-N3)-methyltransferase
MTARVLAPGPFVVGAPAVLDVDAAHHLRVRRVAVGAPVTLLDGVGAVADGTLAGLTRGGALVAVAAVRRVGPLPPVHLLAPIADRDRMLWLAEKATELGVTSWSALRWRRSLGVAPRGEGDAFRAKVSARVRSALEQCGGPWLPEVRSECDPADVAAGAEAGTRYLLVAGAPPMLGTRPQGSVTIALGPEGGIDEEEVALFTAAGFMPVSVAAHVLRFETAGVAAITLVRALLAAGGRVA